MQKCTELWVFVHILHKNKVFSCISTHFYAQILLHKCISTHIFTFLCTYICKSTAERNSNTRKRNSSRCTEISKLVQVYLNWSTNYSISAQMCAYMLQIHANICISTLISAQITAFLHIFTNFCTNKKNSTPVKRNCYTSARCG